MATNYNSLLTSAEGTKSISDLVEEEQETVKSTRGNVYSKQIANLDQILSDSIDGSTRLIGAPHQLLSHNDNRFGNSKLGRIYGEKLLMDAPIVCIRPGVSEFLPGKNSKEKKGFLNAIASYAGGDKNDIIARLNNEQEDVIQYFGIKPDYSGYMNKVNMLCRILATFLDIQNLKVPWDKSTRFATYDWRNYKMKSQFGNLSQGNLSNIFSIFEDFANSASKVVTKDYEFIQFYVMPNAGFSESYSNSTTSSMLENVTDQLSSVAKELQTVSAMTGGDIGNLAEDAVSSLTEYVNSNVKIDSGPIGQMLRRLTGAAKNVINGGNIIIPQIWNDSSADTSYSFEMHLVTPYGNKLAWYINIGVPMMYCIALALPVQQSANSVSSPYLLQAFCPGWWNCQMGIMDSMSIEKGGDGTWNAAGLPNEVTIRFSMKDLYSQLALPQSNSPAEFMANTGMLNFLMTNAGLDISNQTLSDKFEVWKALFENSFSSKLQKTGYDAMMFFKHQASGLFKILE